MASPEVDWDRLDKTKVFFVGVPLFSAVTTALYPLTVIKTRQMASHGVAGGLRGSVQTASSILQTDGIRGFYRGFGTVVFGTIPGRTVYLTTLELTKAAMQSNDALADAMAPTALAGAANFVAGGVASLATQVVMVPIDVISQRLMVEGTDLGVSSSGSSGGGGRSSSGAGVTGEQRRVYSSSSSSSSSGGGGGGGSASRIASGGLASTSGRTAAAWRSPALTPVAEQLSSGAWRCQQQRQQHSQQQQHSSTQWHRALRQRAAAAAVRPFSSGGGGGTNATPAAAPVRMNGFTMAQLIIRQEGLRGLWRGLVPSAALYVPNSAIWWGCYGGWQSAIWLALHPEAAHAHDGGPALAGGGSGEIVAVQTAAAALAGACSAVLTTPLDVLKTRIQVSGGGPGAGAGAQRGATWGGVLRELLKEEGPKGLWRGLAPRMASSSIFGVCMTVTYQALKRWCALPEDEP